MIAFGVRNVVFSDTPEGCPYKEDAEPFVGGDAFDAPQADDLRPTIILRMR